MAWRLKLYRGAWCATDTVEGRTVRRSLGVDAAAREEAERRFAEFCDAVSDLQADQAPVPTVGELIALYRLERSLAGRDPGQVETVTADMRKVYGSARTDRALALLTLVRRRREQPIRAVQRIDYAFRALEKTFAALRPTQVTPERGDAYLAARRRIGRADGSIRKELATLNAAIALGGALRNPDGTPLYDRVDPLQLPPESAARDRWLTREEADRLVAAARSPHVRLFIVLALHTAARKEALLELTWDRVDFTAGRIDLQPPVRRLGAKRRSLVPMTDTARRHLEEALRGAISDHVIEYAGRPIRDVKTGIRGAAAAAGLEGVSPHVLRHTAATWMAQRGVNLWDVAGFLGHRDTRLVERVYGHHHPDYLRSAAAALEG